MRKVPSFKMKIVGGSRAQPPNDLTDGQTGNNRLNGETPATFIWRMTLLTS